MTKRGYSHIILYFPVFWLKMGEKDEFGSKHLQNPSKCVCLYLIYCILSRNDISRGFKSTEMLRITIVDKNDVFGYFSCRTDVHVKIPPKNPPGTKIFNVNIFFLTVETLRSMKNTKKLTVPGGTRWAYLAHGLFSL